MADSSVKDAVGYGFDASLRKGTAAGLAAMRGSKEFQKLDSKGQSDAEKMFNERIKTDSNLKQSEGIGDEKVSVYRKAAKEKPARVIDYKKEFAPKKKEAAASKSKPAAEPAAPAEKKRLFSRPIIAKPAATPAPAKPAAKVAPTPVRPSPKNTPAAPIRKAMGMPDAPKSDKVNVPGMGMMDKDAAIRMRAFKK